MNTILHRPSDKDNDSHRGEAIDVPCKAVSAEYLPRWLRRGRESFKLAGIENGLAHYKQVSA